MIPRGVRRGMGWAGCAAAVAGAAGAVAGGGPAAWGVLAAGALLAQGLLVDTTPVKIPVVMLHSVVGRRPDRPELFDIWCPPEMFEGYLRYLARRGYRTITLDQMYDHIAHGAPIPDKPVVLTFDDGYLDNWVYAAPLLAKYGFTGTVFMPSDFIQPGDTPRPTLEDVWAGRLSESELEAYGYLNEAELRALATSGVMDVQAHGTTHTWLPISERIVDYHRPDLPMRHLRWMWWNRHRDRKPFWHHELSHDGVAWGAPVYESRLALSHRAVEPDPGLERRLVSWVAERGGARFFEQADWRAQLDAVVASYREDHPPSAEPETDEVFRDRLAWELTSCRERLEAITGWPVHTMCWPNGGTCPEAFSLLASCGYRAATVPSRMKQPRNHRGTRPDRIGRISATSYFRGVLRVTPWVLSFALKLERNRGLLWAELPIKAIWLYRRFVPPSGPDPHGGGAAS